MTENKIVRVTGATSGIGAAVAEQPRRAGATRCVAGARRVDRKTGLVERAFALRAAVLPVRRARRHRPGGCRGVRRGGRRPRPTAAST